MMKTKKMLAFVLGAALALSLAACSSGKISGRDPAAAGIGENVQIPNPFTDYEKLEDAVSAAGFPITLPEAIEGCQEPVYRAIEGQLIEVIYSAEGGEERLRIRKSTEKGDISGDYNQYPETETAAAGGLEVLLRGKDGSVCSAIWEADGYSYAITSGDGLDKTFVTDLIGFLNNNGQTADSSAADHEADA